MYFAVFLSAAASAAPPDDAVVTGRYNCSTVSSTVTSQVTLLTFCQGMRVSPFGLLPSDLRRPDGSLAAEMFAADRARQMRSFSPRCRADRPVPLYTKDRVDLWHRPILHVHGHWCGSQMLTLSRGPTAMCTAVSSRRNPQFDSGSACSQSPLCGAVTANSRALSTLSLRLLVSISH